MGSRLDRAEIVLDFEEKRILEPGIEITRAYGQFVDGEIAVAFIGNTGIALDNGLDPKTTFEAIHMEATAILEELEATF